jgi:hemolysin activation/secretion protein
MPKLSVAILVTFLACPVFAEIPASDAERLIREQRETTPMLSPPPSIPLNLNLPPPPQDAPSGGPSYRINSVVFKGNSVFSSEILTALLGNFSDSDKDLGAMINLANRITNYYRQQGYLFARAFIPEQTLTANQLLIEVLEGRYGAISVSSSEPALVKGAEAYFRQLQSGALIESDKLERALLILSDVTGTRIQPLFKPGQLQGTGDLLVEVSSPRQWDIKLEADNFGGRYSGLRRSSLEFYMPRLLVFGDRLVVRTLYTSEDLWLGSINYEFPLGATGWRASLAADRTGYGLTDNFSGFTGRASSRSLALTYPLLRTQSSNAYFSLEFSDRDSDDYVVGLLYNKSKSNAFRPALRFDRRDNWLGGGSNFGSLGFATGGLRVTGITTSKSHFNKFEGQLARTQQLSGPRVLFINILFQLAGRDLNATEGFSIGGPSRVRAYDQSESQGGRGFVGQIELRFLPEPNYPFIFFDTGHVSARSDRSGRNLQGAGVGMRFQHKQLFGDFSLAWRTHGGPPVSNTPGTDPRLWFKLGYRF